MSDHLTEADREALAQFWTGPPNDIYVLQRHQLAEFLAARDRRWVLGAIAALATEAEERGDIGPIGGYAAHVWLRARGRAIWGDFHEG